MIVLVIWRYIIEMEENCVEFCTMFHNMKTANCYLIVVEGFVCPRVPRGYVVQVLLPPDRVSNGKLVLGEGPDKE